MVGNALPGFGKGEGFLAGRFGSGWSRKEIESRRNKI
jgi:hypothetical protein